MVQSLVLIGSCTIAATAQAVDHGVWSTILEEYVDSRGYVDYEGLKAERDAFDRYIGSIENNGPETSPQEYTDRNARLAYYINAYNAMVFKGVLDRGPEQKSVWRGLISGLNFFVRMSIRVDGRNTNLKNLEDDVVRARFNDPRIHAALNCASVSCPRLVREAYTADRLERQLDAAVVEFANARQHVRVDGEKKRVALSKIFNWYEEDFIQFENRAGNTQGSDDEKLIAYVNRYRSSQSQIPGNYRVVFLDYNKRINKQ